MPKTIAPEVIEKIRTLGASGYTHAMIQEATGVSKVTIGKYLREANIDTYHKGGVVAKTINIAPSELRKKEEHKVEKRHMPAVSIGDQYMLMIGRFTGNKYTVTLRGDRVSAEGEYFDCTTRIEDLPDLAKELMAVYSYAVKMKKGE